QISGSTFFRTGTPGSVVQTSRDIAGVGDVGFGQPWDQVGDPNANTNKQLSAGSGPDNNFWFNPAAFAEPSPGRFGNAPRNVIYNPGEQQWDIALFKNFNLGGTKRAQFRAEFFNFPNHPNLSGADFNPLSGNFGRVTGKSNNPRDIQLSLRFQF